MTAIASCVSMCNGWHAKTADCPNISNAESSGTPLWKGPECMRDVAFSTVSISAARHVYLCFQARKRLTQSDEPQLAPYPAEGGGGETESLRMLD